MDALVLAALVTSGGAVVASVLGAVATQRTHREVRSPNGVRTGESIYQLVKDVARLEQSVRDHVADEVRHRRVS